MKKALLLSIAIGTLNPVFSEDEAYKTTFTTRRARHEKNKEPYVDKDGDIVNDYGTQVNGWGLKILKCHEKKIEEEPEKTDTYNKDSQDNRKKDSKTQPNRKTIKIETRKRTSVNITTPKPKQKRTSWWIGQ